jgi:hypothetical protein
MFKDTNTFFTFRALSGAMENEKYSICGWTLKRCLVEKNARLHKQTKEDVIYTCMDLII